MKLQKDTKPANAHGRWYGDACGTAFALEVLGERWSMLIVRELMLGARRFSELRSDLPGISAKVLSERLETLAAWGVLAKKQMAPPVSVQVYELTPWGLLAEPAILEVGRWAARSVLHDPTLPLSPVSLMLSFRTMFDAQIAKGMTLAVGMEVRGESFRVEVTDGVLSAGKGGFEDTQAIMRAPAAPVIAGAVYADIPMAVLEREAGLVVEGDRATVSRLLTLFHLPPKIA